MSEHATIPSDRLELGDAAQPLMRAGQLMAVVFFLAALLSAAFLPSHFGFRRFFFSYLVAYCFFLTIMLGALFFVLIQFVTRAGWAVSVRRVAENIAGLIPFMALLSIPILIAVGMENGELYRWDLPASALAPGANAPHAETPPRLNVPGADQAPIPSKDHPLQIDATTWKKRAWLNPAFFIVRQIFYLAVWSILAMFYRGNSIRQDREKDPKITEKLQKWSGICIVIYGLTVTGWAFDMIMSLDPHWYSTIFGGYIFAGGMVGFFATLILTVNALQHRGWLAKTVSTEHYHDMGKFMFAFTIFWGYMAFSQYMLLWYASFPETIVWLSRRGATTNPIFVSGWSYVAVAVLFGCLLIPFAGLLSRHVKRNRHSLMFWAGWVLFFHYIDMYWLIMPEM
ncbi:MAG TPA: hypothetical protein VHY37_03220, partial [Tepidisphaeraceae bacterium]|nr:hypothetical protein [Tepidisphaeraceae bacterium]